jgi:hypothetical protein
LGDWAEGNKINYIMLLIIPTRYTIHRDYFYLTLLYIKKINYVVLFIVFVDFVVLCIVFVDCVVLCIVCL